VPVDGFEVTRAREAVTALHAAGAVRPRGACDRARGGASGSPDLRASTSALGIRAGASAGARWAGRCASKSWREMSGEVSRGTAREYRRGLFHPGLPQSQADPRRRFERGFGDALIPLFPQLWKTVWTWVFCLQNPRN
jgi:hypothetical protein